MRCEDYPCCGHGPAGDGGACPDKSGRFPCCECGKKMPKNASSSICAACLRRMARRESKYRGYDSDLDHDFSMNY